MTNPTPVAWIHRHTQVHLQIVEKKPSWNESVWQPVYTEAQLNQARADALLEAADWIADIRNSGSLTNLGIIRAIEARAAEIEGEKE